MMGPEKKKTGLPTQLGALSAVALPDELEARLLYRVENPSAWPEGFDQEASDLFAEAHSTIAALRAERDEAQQELKAHELSFDLRYKSDMRACKRWQEATGRTMTLPDHTDLSIWLFAQLETAEAEVKRLTEDNEALRAAIAEIADFDPDGPIDPDTVRLIRIAGAARRAILTQENADGQ